MTHVDVSQAGTRFDELLAQVLRGEEVVITRDSKPLARLSAVQDKPRRRFGSMEGEVWMSDDFDEPLEDFREYM